MGLAGTKNKRKWAKDPNNTAWSRNTDTFGQKMLRSQGWEPGQYLGAKGASHSEFFTSANASHIRAVLKDDNMGLGARRNQGDECTGLDALQELLGRLNGKSEETLDTERKKREDTKMNKYLHRKLGTMRFVFGGYLVGDKVQELADDLKKAKEEAAETSDASEGRKEKKSKKRKAEDDGSITSEKKKEKKNKKRKTDDTEDETKSKRKEKKDKKKKAKSDDSTSESKAEAKSRNGEDPKAEDAEEDTSSRKKSKKDKKDRRKKSKDDDDTASADPSDSQSKKKKKRKPEKDEGTESSKSPASTTVLTTPTASGTSTPVSDVPHRHLARKRFIAQKRAAVMDPAALKQIFMIKA